MQPFRFAIFGFENARLPADLQLVEQIRKAFVAKQPHGKDTLFEIKGTMEDAAKCIDEFKGNTCGSAFTIAVMNLTDSPSLMELEFLMGQDVLGNPATIFLASLKSLQADIYAYARNKCEVEYDRITQKREYAAPSCIDSYSATTRADVAARVAEILNAHLEDKAAREKARQTGQMMPPTNSVAMEALLKNDAIYHGQRRSSKTGVYRGGGGTGRFVAVQNPAGHSNG